MDEHQQTIEQPQGGASGGQSYDPQAAAAANRASLEASYARIQAREKAEASRSPVINDEARQRAVAERKAEEESYRSAGLPAFESAAPASVRDSMSAAFHRAEAREKAAEARRMPVREGSSIRERLEEAAEWRKLPDSDKRLFRGGHDELQSQREAAKWFNLSLEEAKVVAIEKRLEQQDKVSPLLDRFARLAPGQSPEATVQWHADVAEMFRRDPQGTYDWLGQQLGVQQSYRQAAQHQQAMQAQQAAFEQHARASAARAREAALATAVHSSIADFARSKPDFDRLEPEMVAALESGRIRRTGNALTDLRNAYRFCGGSYA